MDKKKDAPNSNNWVYRLISAVYGIYNVAVFVFMLVSLIGGFLLPSMGVGSYWYTKEPTYSFIEMILFASPFRNSIILYSVLVNLGI